MEIHPKSEKTDNEETANILADLFSSVFIVEPREEVPSLEKREISTECLHLKGLRTDNHQELLTNITSTEGTVGKTFLSTLGYL